MKLVEKSSIRLHEDAIRGHKIRGSLTPIPASIASAVGVEIDERDVPLEDVLPRLAEYVPDEVPYGKAFGFGIAALYMVKSYFHFRAAGKIKKFVDKLREFYDSKTYEHMAKADEKRMRRRRTLLLEQKALESKLEDAKVEEESEVPVPVAEIVEDPTNGSTLAGVGEGVKIYGANGVTHSYETGEE